MLTESAVQFTKHLSDQAAVFSNVAPYLSNNSGTGSTHVPSTNFSSLCPENSRRFLSSDLFSIESHRFRALSAWFALTAYSKQEYGNMVDKHHQLALRLSQLLDSCQYIRVLATPILNGVLFTLAMVRMAYRANLLLL